MRVEVSEPYREDEENKHYYREDARAAGDDLTTAYMKGWQDGQDAMRKSVDAAVDSASREEANDGPH